MTKATSESAPDLTTVLGKAVTILRLHPPDDHVLPLAELVRRTGLHKARAIAAVSVTGPVTRFRPEAHVDAVRAAAAGLAATVARRRSMTDD